MDPDLQQASVTPHAVLIRLWLNPMTQFLHMPFENGSDNTTPEDLMNIVNHVCGSLTARLGQVAVILGLCFSLAPHLSWPCVLVLAICVYWRVIGVLGAGALQAAELICSCPPW